MSNENQITTENDQNVSKVDIADDKTVENKTTKKKLTLSLKKVVDSNNKDNESNISDHNNDIQKDVACDTEQNDKREVGAKQKKYSLYNKNNSVFAKNNTHLKKDDKQNQKNSHKENAIEDDLVEDEKTEKHTKNKGTEDEIRFYLKDLKKKKADDLFNTAESLGIINPSNLQTHNLVFAILQKLSEKHATIVAEGTLEILPEGYGFLRSTKASYFPCTDDIYISPNQIRKNSLRTGDTVVGTIRAPKHNERYFAIINVEKINNMSPEISLRRRHFDDLTPLFPNKRIQLERVTQQKTKDLAMRVVDIVSPIGRGQRALVVAPPRTGKTVLMQNIAHSITENYPEIELIVLLIDERPEEVTDMARSVKGEVVSSTFDEPSNRHVQLAEIVIEKAKRLVEVGKDVVILLDSITRLARAYNNIAPSSGKVLSGGVDSNALQRPKRFFGAARNVEEGGSLTIIATALIETGSRMDEVIFEEFKGTGNSEIILDRKLSDRRIFPAIDIIRSGTRKEDLLVDKNTLSKMWILRGVLNPMGVAEAMEFMLTKLKQSETNEEFFESMDTYSAGNKSNR